MENGEKTGGLFREARDRGGAYLLTHMKADGSFGAPERGLADYYKVISAFQASGASYAANQACSWVRKHGMTPEGDFVPRPSEANEYYYAYYNSWVVVGAHRLGQYDISQRGMDFLMRFWDPESGGFYSSATERDVSTQQDIWVVCGCGRAALATGRIDVALGTGKWLRRMMEAQPDFPRKLYGVFSRAEGLCLKFKPEDDIRYVIHNDATRDQYFFNPGIAGGFLAQLYLATGQSQWLDLAKEYMRFAEHANDYLFKLLRAGKVGWAASLLYTITGEEKYREMAIRVGKNLLATQSGNGEWLFQGMSSVDVTAEMVAWLDEIYQAVGDKVEASVASSR